MIDIDNFKTINDTYGHLAGDNLIEMVASTLYESIRMSDYIFRYGGDEFLILLLDTTIESSKVLANQLIKDINCKKIEIEGNREINVSISVGIALSNESSDYLNIISKADQALFNAKEAGRNCYSIVH